MTRKRYLVLLILLETAVSASAGQTLRQLATPPLDSAEAERLRVWLPVEQPRGCRVRINIRNASNKVVRHFVDQRLPHGYYNFYWDKRDDSGAFVAAGTYRSIASYCGEKRVTELAARFKKWERESCVYPGPEGNEPGFRFELLDDSAIVSLEIFDRRGRLVDCPFSDSLMHRGSYEFIWHPGQGTPFSVYTCRLHVGDFIHAFAVRRRR